MLVSLSVCRHPGQGEYGAGTPEPRRPQVHPGRPSITGASSSSSLCSARLDLNSRNKEFQELRAAHTPARREDLQAFGVPGFPRPSLRVPDPLLSATAAVPPPRLPNWH